MKDLLGSNPTLVIAVIIFILCVIIGFFGDRYLRKQNKIGKILDGDDVQVTGTDSSYDASKTSNTEAGEPVLNDVSKTVSNAKQATNLSADGNDNKPLENTQVNQDDNVNNSFNVHNT